MAPQTTTDSVIDRVLAVWARRRLLTVAVFAPILVGGVTLALSLPAIYRSTAIVLVERQEMRDALVRPAAITEIDARLNAIGQEILSRARIEGLMERFDLYPALRARRQPEAAVERLRRAIQIELKGVEPSGRGTTIAFAVSFRGRDPQTVAQVANALASFYVEENAKMRERQASSAARVLAGQLEETKGQLDEQETRVGEFKRRYIGELPEQVTANLATLHRLNAQLALNSDNQLRGTERRAALVKQLGDLELGTGAAGGDGVPTRLGRLKQDLAGLRKQYSDKYPDVAQLRAQIAALERQGPDARPGEADDPTVTAIRKSLTELDAEAGRLRAEEQRLRNDIATYQRRVEAAPEREQAFQQMSRDYRTTKERYESILKRYQDALIAEEGERRRADEEFRLLDPAVPGREPLAPNRFRLVLLSFLLALGAATAAAVIAENLDGSFHTLDDLRAFTSVPVLAIIPRIASAADSRRAALRRGLAAGAITAGLVVVMLISHQLARGNEQLVWLLSRAS